MKFIISNKKGIQHFSLCDQKYSTSHLEKQNKHFKNEKTLSITQN
jgi:hypothetical protein